MSMSCLFGDDTHAVEAWPGAWEHGLRSVVWSDVPTGGEAGPSVRAQSKNAGRSQRETLIPKTRAD